TNSVLVKVPFDLERWQRVATERFPDGLPEPYSNDPTQWLFDGDPRLSEQALQVAILRLLGYRWPQQNGDSLDKLAEADGILCLPAVQGQQPGAERLRAFLAATYALPQVTDLPRGAPPPPDLPSTAHEWIDQLLVAAGYAGKSLEEWLRD